MNVVAEPIAESASASTMRAGLRSSSLLLVVLALSALLIVLHVKRFTLLSPIDELQHIDYLEKASRGELVRRGDKVGNVAMREEACRGIDAPGFVPPPCHTVALQAQDFQEGGYNTAWIHPPLYYAITGVVARALLRLPGIDSLVTAGRLANIIWLGPAVILLWVLLAELGLASSTRLAALTLLIASPGVLHSVATINPDATALASGAAVLLAAVLWERGSLPLSGLVVIAFAGLALKPTNVLGVGVAVAYLLARATQRPEESPGTASPSWRRLTLGAAALVAGAVISGAIWMAVQKSVARVDLLSIPMNQRFHVSTLSLGQVLGEVPAAMTPLHDAYLSPPLRTHTISSFVWVTEWLLLGASLGAVALAGRGSRLAAFGAATLLLMAATGPLLVAVNYVSFRAYVPIPPRYGLSIVPALGVVLAGLLQKPPVTALVGALAAGSALSTLLALAR